MRRAIVAVIAVALPISGCSTTWPHWSGPFTNPANPHFVIGSYVSKPVLVGGVYDILVPDFHNYSHRVVRIESVRLVSPHRGIGVLGARAYPYGRTQGTTTIDEGDLARDCPRYFVQHPISDVAVAPKSDTKWYVVLAVKFLKPGMHYHFGVAKIEYITAGKQGWQYYRLPNLYLRTVSNPQLYSPDSCR